MTPIIGLTARWIALGLLLLIVEASLAGSFVAVFFAVGAFVAAASHASGLAPHFAEQCLAFAGAATLSLALARRPLLVWARNKARATPLDVERGATALVSTAMAPQATGEVSLHGAPWMARNVGHEALQAGDVVRVESAEGLCLLVKRVDAPGHNRAGQERASDVQ